MQRRDNWNNWKVWAGESVGPIPINVMNTNLNGLKLWKTEDGVLYGAPEGTRKLKSFEWLDCTNNKVLNVAIAQTIKFRMSRLHKQ